MPTADPQTGLPRIVALDEVGSTNNFAMKLAGEGERGPLWVTARRQTQGRGRSGRTWTSVDGNLYASLLLTLAAEPRDVPHLSLLAGVAVHDAIAGAAGDAGRDIPGLRLKWPNDVLIGPAKVAGILPESTTGSGGLLTVVVGVGLNVAGAPEGVGRAATSLADAGLIVAPEAMVARLDRTFAAGLASWQLGRGFPAIRDAWLSRAGPLGEAIQVNAGGGPVVGAFGGVDHDGALLLREPGGALRRFTYGDVTVAADIPPPVPDQANDRGP